MSMLAECQQIFNLPEHMKKWSPTYTYFSYPVTNCDKVWTPFFTFLEYHSTFYYVKSPKHILNLYLSIVQEENNT